VLRNPVAVENGTLQRCCLVDVREVLQADSVNVPGRPLAFFVINKPATGNEMKQSTVDQHGNFTAETSSQTEKNWKRTYHGKDAEPREPRCVLIPQLATTREVAGPHKYLAPIASSREGCRCNAAACPA
jgi:predicted metalloprotease